MKAQKIVALFVIILLTAAIGFLFINGAAWGIYEIRPILEQIPRGLDLTGGVSVVYEAKDLSDPNLEANMASVYSVMRSRLDAQGYTEATMAYQGSGRIRLEIPINETQMVEDPSIITEYLIKPAKIEFQDPDGNVLFEGSDIEEVYVAQKEGYLGQYMVAFNLNQQATENFAEATTRLAALDEDEVGSAAKAISIIMDGTVISSPVVNDAITTGRASIESVTFTYETANLLCNQIQSGALPIEMEEIEVRSVSATLGADVLEKSVLAGVIGIALVFIFMIAYYRLPGLIAVLALIIYMLIVMFCLATIPGVQLTLPGIAGLILSIGMAVDANVIIFERMREELRTGKSIRTSVKMGFKRAFSAVLDSNITTVIAAIVLLIFGTGSIKGFAITLLIGIVVSFITSVLITRGLMNLLLGFNIKKKTLFCPMKKAKQAEQ